MLTWASKVRVFVHRGPADMRKSYDTLAGLVQDEMKGDVLAGDFYLFVGRDRRRAKILCFDGTGMCILQKRLARGRFADVWAKPELTPSELSLFLEGSTQVGSLTLSPARLRKAELSLRPEDFL